MRPQTRTVPVDARIAELAERQHGVASREQLLAIGVTPSMLRTRIAKRTLVRLHRGVYALGHRRLRPNGHRLAAVLAMGPGAALSHRDAAAVHGLRPANRARIDVTTTSRGRTSQPGIDLHHTTTLEPHDLTTVDGIPVTTVACTLVDLAAVVPKDQLAKALREAEQQRTADLHEIEDAMRRTRHRPGNGHRALRAVLDEHRRLGTQLTRSVLEDRFLALLDAHHVPRPLTNVHLHGIEVDACWPAARLVVELDGYAHHSDRRAFQRDRDKGNALTDAGFTVLRHTHDDVVRRPRQVAERIRRRLAEAA